MKRMIKLTLFLSIMVIGISIGFGQLEEESSETMRYVINAVLKLKGLIGDLEKIPDKEENFKKNIIETGKLKELTKKTVEIHNTLAKLMESGGFDDIKASSEIIGGFKKQIDDLVNKEFLNLKKPIDDLKKEVQKLLKGKLHEMAEKVSSRFNTDMERFLDYLNLQKENEYLKGKKIRFGFLFGFDLAPWRRETSYFVCEDGKAREARVSTFSSLVSAVIVYEWKLFKKDVDFVINIPLLEIPLFSESGSDKIDNIFNKLLDLGLGAAYPIGPNWNFSILFSHSRIELMDENALETMKFENVPPNSKIDLSKIDATVQKSRFSITFGIVYKLGKSSRHKYKK